MQVLRAIPKSQSRLLVFDLDGTLIDSREDLAKSINVMLAHYQRAALPLDVIASYVGDGAGMLVRRALGDPDDEVFVQEALEKFLASYRIHLLDHTYVYDGVIAALKQLQQTGVKMAVLTNKPVMPSIRICEALGVAPFFFRIYGGNSFHTKKPDPHGLLELVREAGARPEGTVMIGDSDVDVLTARAAGAWVVGCTFGLAPHTLQAAPPDVLVDSPAEWAAAILG